MIIKKGWIVEMRFSKVLFTVGTLTLLMQSVAFAQEGGAPDSGNPYGPLAAAFAIAVAAFGGALGQGRTAAAALEGIARNPAAQPKIQTAMILGLALIESLVIYALVIAFMIK